MAKVGGIPKLDEIGVDNVVPKFHQGGFRFKAVKADAWNAYFPYQLLILHDEGGGNYTITPWRYTLPIPPQELQVSMPVADKVEATLGGYNEVFGGAPFRNISFSGTTGVLPETIADSSFGQSPKGRDSVNDGNDSGSFLTTFTAPLVNAFNTTVFGGPKRVRNEYSEQSFPDAITGFYFFHQLRYFLEGYLAIKGHSGPILPGSQDDSGTPITGLTRAIYPDKVRLAFCMWRDESVYLCRLANFDMRRDAGSPLEYRYSLQLQAFKRVELKKRGKAFEVFRLPVPKKNLLTNILNRIDGVRKVVANVANLVQLGVVGPLAVISELSRQISGIIKDTLGIVRSVLDMPEAFVNGVLNAAFEIKQQAMAGAQGIADSLDRLKGLPAAVENKLSALGFIRQGPTLEAGPELGQTQLAQGAAVGGQGNAGSDFQRPDTTGGQRMNSANIDPRDILQEVPEIGDLGIDAFPLNNEQQQQLQDEKDASAQVSVADIQTIRSQIQDNLNNFAASIGSWDTSYNEVYGLTTPTTAQREPTREELDLIFAVNEMLIAVDQFITYLQDQGGKNEPTVTSVEYIAGLAERSEIDFNVPRSKYAVPMPHGATLERVALQFLGDANRWNEIATLNGLRAPYIDEEGFELPMLVNGEANTVVVGNRDNLFIGQPIYLSSDGQRRESRRILGIHQNSPGVYVLTLSGDPDLGRFLVAENAVINAFLPGTVNSLQLIYIPSDTLPSVDENLSSIAGVDPYDPFLRVGGIDWQLTPKLDLVVTPYGDVPLVFGLTSLTQAAMVAFKTTRGALLQHPTWGMGFRVGTSVNDFNLPSFIHDLQAFFEDDPAIAGLKSVNVTIQGNTMLVNAQLSVRGSDRSLPVLLPLDIVR